MRVESRTSVSLLSGSIAHTTCSRHKGYRVKYNSIPAFRQLRITVSDNLTVH